MEYLMKILVDIPAGQTVGTATIQGTAPPVDPPPTTGGPQPGPWGVMLSVQILGTLQPGSGNHQFVPSSRFISTVQLTGNFTNGGFSSPPPVFQGCCVALGTVPGGSNVKAWEPGSDSANITMQPPGGNGLWMSMVLNPTHPQPPGASFYSAN